MRVNIWVSFARNDNDVESSVIVFFFVVSDVILNGHSTHSDDITDNKELLDDVSIPLSSHVELYHFSLLGLDQCFQNVAVVSCERAFTFNSMYHRCREATICTFSKRGYVIPATYVTSTSQVCYVLTIKRKRNKQYKSTHIYLLHTLPLELHVL